MIQSKLLILTLVLVSISQGLMSQSVFNIDLSSHALEVQERMFFIEGVKDSRNSTTESIGLGIYYQDDLANWDDVVFTPSLETYLSNYFSQQLPDEGIGQMGIRMSINKLVVKDVIYPEGAAAILELEIDYYYGDAKLFTDQRMVESPSAVGTSSAHENNIVEAFKASLIAFDAFDWPTAILNTQQIQSSLQEEANPEVESYSLDKPQEREYVIDTSKDTYDLVSENRNVITIGYQIGGYTLVGVDYEFRLSDVFGVHAGGGFLGGTVGTKIHFGAAKNSSFIDLSYKDAGFGIMDAIAVEYGGRWVFRDGSDFGILYQVGLASIRHIDEDFENQYFDGNAPLLMFSWGIGFSW